MSASKKLLDIISRYKDFKKINSTRDLKGYNLITYCVIQGDNILTIGSGEVKRLKTLMGNKGSHNKAPIIGLCNRIYKSNIEFYICGYTKGQGSFSLEERALQSKFGEVNIDGHKEYKSSMIYLREKLEIIDNPVLSVLLDLMETHGDILQHSLNTPSTGQLVEDLFKGYWKKSNKIKD